MPLLSDKVKRLFDEREIFRGCAVRVKRRDDLQWRMGLVQSVMPEKMRVIYSNVQNGAISYLDISSSEVASGMWEIAWSKDLVEIFYEGGEGSLSVEGNGDSYD